MLNVEELNNMAVAIGKLIQEGITYNDEKIPFTLLDYWTVCKIFPGELNRIGKQNRTNLPRLDSFYRGVCYEFCRVHGYLYPNRREVTIEETESEHNAFIINDEKYVPTREDIENIFATFEENDIPKTSKLVYIALYRLAKNWPILPLANQDEKAKTR